MKNYTNPIIKNEKTGKVADPYVLKVGEYYYHCYSISGVREDAGVYLARSKELWNIGEGETKRVFKTPGKETVWDHWYAPELHRIDGVWYIYGAPLINENGIHCMSVLENKSDDPMEDYINLGMVKGLENRWCIDGTVFEHEGEKYFVWAGESAHLRIAKMDGADSVTEPHVSIARPELPFETKVNLIIEGPAVLKRNGKIHIVYSANDSRSDDYCLGVITYEKGDVMNLENWIKRQEVSFAKTDKIFGPGHCSFTTVEENGKEVDYIAYHANLTSGDNWKDRNVFIQPFTWDENDMPVFGAPQF